MNRRQFVTAALGLGVQSRNLWGDAAIGNPGKIDETLRSGISGRKIPAAVGMAATGSKTLYAGAFGNRDFEGTRARVDSIFALASMTKAVTTVAAMQLVEQGKVKLDEPVSQYLQLGLRKRSTGAVDSTRRRPISTGTAVWISTRVVYAEHSLGAQRNRRQIRLPPYRL